MRARDREKAILRREIGAALLSTDNPELSALMHRLGFLRSALSPYGPVMNGDGWATKRGRL